MFNLKEWLGLSYYTSKLDAFLAHFRRTHPNLTASQRTEVDKYKKIFAERDGIVTKKPKNTLWEKF